MRVSTPPLPQDNAGDIAHPVTQAKRIDASVQEQWLRMQCEMLHDVALGLLFKANESFSFAEIEASWPVHLAPPESVLRKALDSAKHDKFIVEDVPADGGTGKRLRLYQPVVSGNERRVLVFEIGERSDAEQASLANLLRWNCEWLRFALTSVPQIGQRSFATSFTLAISALEQHGFKATATALVTELSARYLCQRVSLGLSKGRRTRVEILSHSARFKQESNLIQDIGAAMDEAVDQDCRIGYPALAQDTHRITQAHQQLLTRAGSGSVCTLPISEGGRVIGALTLERESSQAFETAELDQVEQVLAVVAPTLWLRHEEEQGLVIKIAKSLKRFLKRLFGSEHVRLKLAALATVSLICFGYLAQGDWRVTADAVVEGRVQRTIAAPIDGYIASSDARPGDQVKSGQLIGALDDSDLRLERLKWSTLRQQMVSELREARAQNSRAEVSIITAKIEQADAELELVDEQLSRTRLKAPFDGVVIEGDLSQLLGTPVKRGDALFKIAPLDDYRIVLLVDEQDIAPVLPGMPGRLILASLPDRPIALEITRVTPVSDTGQGRNYFRVEAKPQGTTLGLQPGMEGVGKITVGEARLAWIWSRELLTWVRLQTWTWWR